uniref:Zinc transporter ZIP4/12 EF-hand domain-containing protein n=1 Tax=Gasterosteus aculeatus aculeatus TaxID=481459 RepID=G3NJ47_GASAC
MFVSALLILASWGSFGPVSGSPAEKEAYRAVLSIVAPGQQHLNRESLGSVFNTLEKRVQCGEVSCEKSCVTASDLTTEVDASSADQEVGPVLGRILYHALRGHCFISTAVRHASLPEESFFLDFIMERLGSTNFTVWDLEALMTSLHIGPDHEHHVDEHADHDHSGLSLTGPFFLFSQFCASGEELLLIYGLADNSSVSSGLSRTDFARLSPALVQQILSGACAGVTEPPTPDGLTETEKYIYATIANVLITLTSMFGIVVLLCTSCTSVFQNCIQFCISLAVGSLTGDALLHLVPMFLDLHVHSDKTDSHNHSLDAAHEETPDYIYKMLVLIGGIYLFYLMETIFSLVAYKDNHHHQHHHGEESEPHHCDHGRVLEMYGQERKQKDKSHSASKADLVSDYDDEKSLSEPKEFTKEQRLLPYMITIGDGIHNFADGLAMGAAFSLSWKSGLATSIAVLCHELPHELGDFAILLNSGLSVRKALLLNVGSAMTSFVGLYIALSVATDLATKQWIAAVSAGLFLYIGLADMLPTMVHIRNKKPWLVFLLQNLGLLTGWGVLLLLSLYEERISF